MLKRVLLGICGSVAAYKSPDIVRNLKKNGFNVTCIITRSAQNFVTRFALANVSESKCYTDEDFWNSNNLHIDLVRNHDYLLIAPASLQTLSKLSLNLADNLLLNCCASFEKKIICIPSMHTEMFNKATKEKVFSRLKSKGVYIVGPIKGELLSGDFGLGRMLEPVNIAKIVNYITYGSLGISKKKVVVVSGGTKENIDPVRQITNASSGLMGQTIAAMACVHNAEVTLISTEVCSDYGYKSLIVEPSFNGLKEALINHAANADIIIMAAAISDYIPKFEPKKLKRTSKKMSLELFPTQDLLKLVKETYPSAITIGFCLQDDIDNHSIPLEKSRKKNCDFIISNTAENLGNTIRTYSLFQKETFIKKIDNVKLCNASYEILSLI